MSEGVGAIGTELGSIEREREQEQEREEDVSEKGDQQALLMKRRKMKSSAVQKDALTQPTALSKPKLKQNKCTVLDTPVHRLFRVGFFDEKSCRMIRKGLW